MSEDEPGVWVDPECFRAYVSAEIKIPNTLTAVGPYVGRAVLASLPRGDDLKPAVEAFATTFAFSPNQLNRASKTVVLLHRRFAIAVMPEGTDLRGEKGIRIFGHPRFEVVYMEGVMNILEAILRLHGRRGRVGFARAPQVAEVLADPDRLAVTSAAFVAAEEAINSPEATELSENFKETFNFAKSGETPRGMRPEEKDRIQGQVVPFLEAAVVQALAECSSNISREQVTDFVRVLTSPELHPEAA